MPVYAIIKTKTPKNFQKFRRNYLWWSLISVKLHNKIDQSHRKVPKNV